MFFTTVNAQQNKPVSTQPKPLQVKYGRHKGNRVTKAEPSCFAGFASKVKDVLSAGKRIAKRIIRKIEDCLYTAGIKINDFCEEMYTKVKNIKTPFRKNYVDVNIAGCHAKIGRQARVQDLFK